MQETIQENIRPLTLETASPDAVRKLRTFLEDHRTFDFPMLPNGLFSAARLNDDALYTGYNNVWVRDNIHIAFSHLVAGRVDIACRNIMAIGSFFQRYRCRFVHIISGLQDPSDPMRRPHIRFHAGTMLENDEQWAHAQNDALAYFLWLYCKIALDGHISLAAIDWDLIALFPLYFNTINFWQDEDSGHWEEARKVEASSIGTVIASLVQLQQVMSVCGLSSVACAGKAMDLQLIDSLIHKGRTALAQILPSECIQKGRERRYDAALLFLIFPLQVVDEQMTETILRDVQSHLVGEHGVRRYLGDSFWCANYKQLQSPESRTVDFSADMSARDALLQPGEEAQWCIFDPILSTIYGRRYLNTRDIEDFEMQKHYLDRSLCQLTTEGSGFQPYLCPELYYLDGDKYVPNDVTPLLWTQANLSNALIQMETSSAL